MRLIHAIAFLFVTLSACTDFSKSIGHLGESCSLIGTCRGGLVCVEEVCVEGGDIENERDMDSDPAEIEIAEYDPLSCSNGVCTDPATGFEWQETPTGGPMKWKDGKTHCNELTLDGGGWRLPNISELRSLIRNCSFIETDGVCGVQDECLSCGVSSDDVCLEYYNSCYEFSFCNPSFCSNDGGPTGCYWPLELSGTCGLYWSSSPVEDYDFDAWYVNFNGGDVYYYYVHYDYDVRCVRDAP